ncbi:MAG: hypothetical protein GTO51_05275 [Candidatus Latescibacteria bacterium]|nr:hypothetical protein [Candidatus Latescibacterota bacterium]NIO28414.1 hypothetical protein [Candidatus Latescibacterota bacterium]NIO55963.1 hypothetical protein [Candidatus Latescibacterota bacterium]NIT01927.1 hypothetical protein [Candidatus Latescibacterota bacterium]
MEKILRIGSVFALVCLLFSFSCSQKSSEKATVEENDGSELLALMDSARTAVKKGDFESYQSLYSAISQAKTDWNEIESQKKRRGLNRILQLMEPIELERENPSVRITSLSVEAFISFFDEDAAGKTRTPITWKFRRGEGRSKWMLADLNIDLAEVEYGSLLRDLQRMSRIHFLALQMDWEESINPRPLLLKVYRALAAEDMETLKATTLDGTLFSAFEKKVEMPTLAYEDDVSGRHNRDISTEYLKDLIKNVRIFSNELGISPEELIPYFGSYGVTSLPSGTSKLRVRMNFDGESLSDKVRRFALAWIACRINGRWLIDSVYIESYELYE